MAFYTFFSIVPVERDTRKKKISRRNKHEKNTFRNPRLRTGVHPGSGLRPGLCLSFAFADDKPVTIRLGNFNANGEPGQAASLKFAELENEYSGGTITVEVHNNS